MTIYFGSLMTLTSSQGKTTCIDQTCTCTCSRTRTSGHSMRVLFAYTFTHTCTQQQMYVTSGCSGKFFVNINVNVCVCVWCVFGGARELSPAKLTVIQHTLRIALESPARVGISVLSKSKQNAEIFAQMPSNGVACLRPVVNDVAVENLLAAMSYCHALLVGALDSQKGVGCVYGKRQLDAHIS